MALSFLKDVDLRLLYGAVFAVGLFLGTFGWQYLLLSKEDETGIDVQQLGELCRPVGDTLKAGTEDEKVCVDVSGAVMVPGVYCLEPGDLVVNAVVKAGDINRDAYASRYVSQVINLSQPLEAYQKIYIPFEDDVVCEAKSLAYVKEIEESEEKVGEEFSFGDEVGSSETSKGEEKNSLETSKNETGDADKPATEQCINVNTASLDELMGIKGIGESTAQSIIEARPYKKIEELLDVKGIGESKFETLKAEVCI